jgi:hypothetical protein
MITSSLISVLETLLHALNEAIDSFKDSASLAPLSARTTFDDGGRNAILEGRKAVADNNAQAIMRKRIICKDVVKER